MLGGGVDAATLAAALKAGPPPPECRWGRRPHRGATACRLLERDDRGVDGPGVEGAVPISVRRDTSLERERVGLTHTEGTHSEGIHTGDPHRGEGPTEDPPPEGLKG